MKITMTVEWPSEDRELANKLVDELQETAKITLEEMLYPNELPDGVLIKTEHSLPKAA